MCDRIDCRYNRYLNSSCKERACHYCLDVHAPRLSDSNNCTKYVQEDKTKKKQSLKVRRGEMSGLWKDIKKDVWNDCSRVVE